MGGDSWFASVKCARELKLRGMHFIGVVKRNHADFPMKHLQAAVGEEKGEWVTYKTKCAVEDQVIPILALGYRRGRNQVQTMVSTCGVTTQGTPLKYDGGDGEDAYVLSWKCPRLVNDWTLAQPSVDLFNRYRQHELAMEKALITTRFDVRLFTSMLSTVFINTWMAWRQRRKS